MGNNKTLDLSDLCKTSKQEGKFDDLKTVKKE